MAFGKAWYKRRQEITEWVPTSQVCARCNSEVMLDKEIKVPFCGCGYHELVLVSTGIKLFQPRQCAVG
jgi:hypothetical protein